MDAGKYYALLRFEEAALAIRASLKLDMVERIGSKELDVDEFRDLFGFTHQGARTFAFLLEVMEVLERSGRTLRISRRAAMTLADQLPTSRKPYLALGTGDEVDELIAQLRGEFAADSLPLYGGEDVAKTAMDVPDIAREISMGLASRARNFAEPLANVIRQHAGKGRIFADIGAGSPYVAAACLEVVPQIGRAILVDRPNGMVFVREMAKGIANEEKLEFFEADFFESVPPADIYCVSNTAHDWSAEEYIVLLKNVRDSIAPGGVACIHEPLMLDDWNSAEQWINALWMACYALSLYKLTNGKGTCYTQDEHNGIMARCGFVPIGEAVATRDGCTALTYMQGSDRVNRRSGEIQAAHQSSSTRG